MKRNRRRKILHAILAPAVVFSMTVSDMLIFVPEGAHAQEPLRGKLAYIGPDQNIWLANADGSARQQLTFSGGVHAFAWSPDGERIAFIKDQQPASRYLYPNRLADLMILDLSNLSERIVIPDIMFFRSGHSLDWAPDGHRIAFHAAEGLERVPLYWVTYLIDIESSALEAVAEYEVWPTGWPWPFVSSAVSFSPDGQYLLDYRAGIIPLGVAAAREELPCGRVWSSDGKRVVCRNPLRVLDLDGDILAEYEVQAASVASSPQGDKLAVGGTVGEDAGLWIVDVATGELHRLVSTSHAEEAWEPAWSPDGTQLAFTYITEWLGEYEGGGEIEGIGLVNVDGTGLKVITGAYWPAWRPAPPVDLSGCGEWDGTTSDQRIRLTRISEASGDDCRGAFLLGNGTGIWGLGGYTLELQIQRSENASGVWITLPEESPPLLPSLDLELHTFPVDRYSEAHISIEGSMTLTSFTADTALFLLKTALAFVPGRACVVPDEQLAYATVRVPHIIAPAAHLALEGDLIGARQELQQLLPEFLARSSAALKEIGLDCAAEFLKAIIGQPAVIVKLGVAYMTWVPVAIMDYFKYQGWPAYASLVYEASPSATPVGSPTPTKGDQADLAITDLYPYYGDRPPTVEGSPIAMVMATVKNNGPGSLTNVSVWMSCSSEAKNANGTTSTTITKEGEEIISLLPGQHEDLTTWQFVHSALGSWFIVTCTIALPNDLNPANNIYTERLP